MERCNTCRWWDKVATSGVILGLEDPSGPEHCWNTKFQPPGGPMEPDGVQYGFAHFANAFRPGPEFGCVHWQAKEGSDG